MADLNELERHIEGTQVQLQDALTRLKGFAALQQSLDGAGAGLQEGGHSLKVVAARLGETAQGLDAAVASFRAAVDAMREATPEALSRNVDVAMAAAQRTEQSAAQFQAAMREEIGEQRESLERRVLAVESGLEQTRGNLTQMRKALEERLDDVHAAGRSRGRLQVALGVLTLAAVLGALLLLLPAGRALLGAA